MRKTIYCLRITIESNGFKHNTGRLHEEEFISTKLSFEEE